MNPLLIAEVKTESPFGFVSEKTWRQLFDIANKHGDIISIHTDKRWGGSFDLISKAKELTKKPVLAKGIHATDLEVEEAIKRGADYVLVVGRIPLVHQDKCLIEVESLKELAGLPKGTRAVWNSRDLKTGGFKKETLEEARFLWKGWLCQASNISNYSDIGEGINAVLVGTNLESFVKDRSSI